jgi:sugar O-acyltransferase (sialic acid O-acetyltransferase NeuD family)
VSFERPIVRIILFGVRSPLAVDYEESCRRAGVEIVACVSVSGTPRVFDADKVTELADFHFSSDLPPFIACAFSPSRRQELTEMGIGLGLTLGQALVDPSSVIASTVRIGDGSYVNAAVVIGAASLLGRGVVVNRSASLGHHTMLGDFVSIGPGATLAGNVRVDRASVIGAGAVIQPDIRIGATAVVAAGSVVRRHVKDGATVAGNPAVERRYDPKRGSLNVPDGE